MNNQADAVPMMEQRMSVIALGVEDLARSRSFYEQGLGWSVAGGTNEKIVFFQLGGVVLSLYPEDLLAEDVTVESDRAGTFRGVTLAYNTRSPEEVDPILQFAADAGGRIVKPGQEALWGGYSGYFADPDGHLWEVVWNPFWNLSESGALRLPDDET